MIRVAKELTDALNLMLRFQRLALCFVLTLLIEGLSGCTVGPYFMNRAADALASQGLSNEDDTQLAREASAFYLKLSESILRETPQNSKLAESVAAGFTQYAYAFVAFDAEKLEPQDAKASQKIRERAARLYLRAHQHAMRALEISLPGFKQALERNDLQILSKFEEQHVGLAYWAAASWGGFISLSKDDSDILADLPLAVNLASLAWKKNPNFKRGGLTSLMGTFEASRPGGSISLAETYFNQAITQSNGESASPWVAKAENIALKKQDSLSFTEYLKTAIEISHIHRNLENQVMRERARWLLDMSDDLF
jgi:predicted anti-sigma-YlaC factor YlaD